MEAIQRNITSTWNTYAPSQKTVERGFLVSSVVLSILSFIPSLRLPAALALRAVACLSSASIAHHRFYKGEQRSLINHLEDVRKIAITALGLAGLIVGSPVLILVSLVIETASQGFACLRAWIYEKNLDKGLIHFGLFVVGILTISALATGAWPVIVAAVAVNVIVMIGIAVKIFIEARTFSDGFEGFCYIALAISSIIGAGFCAEVREQRPKTYYYSIHNDSDKTMNITDGYGHFVRTIEPGQTGEFSVDFGKAYYNGLIRAEVAGHDALYYRPSTLEYGTTYYQPPISVEQMPTAPLTGAVLVTEETMGKSE